MGMRSNMLRRPRRCISIFYVQYASLRCMSLYSSSRVSMRSAAPAFGPHWMRQPGCRTVLTAAHR
ncbi:Hypothetical protein MSYG_0945 [Malassezia sympodialis ATCC 42132]|uniref:Uncharacterized protein n=1 Tax=Malassezia sympodialis (strain ATCC 42132) TaxID=1230383 RepID=A0A1M8A2N6_MALS4|nr:Hypothetical protein MSYG_0945 [Malassezia sympodialis ATCC 42132]